MRADLVWGGWYPGHTRDGAWVGLGRCCITWGSPLTRMLWMENRRSIADRRMTDGSTPSVEGDVQELCRRKDHGPDAKMFSLRKWIFKIRIRLDFVGGWIPSPILDNIDLHDTPKKIDSTESYRCHTPQFYFRGRDMLDVIIT